MFDAYKAQFSRDYSNDSFERKVLEMDTKIRKRNNLSRDEDIGLTNYSELNLTQTLKPSQLESMVQK